MPADPEQQTTELVVRTLYAVTIDIELLDTDDGVQQTLVITKMPAHEQIRVPMSQAVGDTVRKKWTNSIAKAKKAAKP